MLNFLSCLHPQPPSPSPPSPCPTSSPPSSPTHSSCLESLYVLSLYDEPSAAVDGVGELRLMTLGNQGSSELQKGRNRNRAPPSPNRDEGPCLGSEGPTQLREELTRTYTVRFIIKNIKNIIPQSIPVGSRRVLPSWHCSALF